MISGCKGTNFGIINQISFEIQKILLKHKISKAEYSKTGFKQTPKQNKTPKRGLFCVFFVPLQRDFIDDGNRRSNFQTC
jgi:hypothetical protein